MCVVCPWCQASRKAFRSASMNRPKLPTRLASRRTRHVSNLSGPGALWPWPSTPEILAQYRKFSLQNTKRLAQTARKTAAPQEQ